MNFDGKSKSAFWKHARNFSYAINLNETEYIALFFLTEKIYGLVSENLIFKKNILRQKQKKHVVFYWTQQVC